MYPGLNCDVPSRYYSYSFRPNPNWCRTGCRRSRDPGLFPAGGRRTRPPDGLPVGRVPGFPNLFMLMGAHSPIGNQSLIPIAEDQADYAMSWINQPADFDVHTA
jgi:hypothetical protein